MCVWSNVLRHMSCVTSPGSNVLGHLFWVTCPGSPVLGYLPWITCLALPVLRHLSWLTCPGSPYVPLSSAWSASSAWIVLASVLAPPVPFVCVRVCLSVCVCVCVFQHCPADAQYQHAQPFRTFSCSLCCRLMHVVSRCNGVATCHTTDCITPAVARGFHAMMT